jgi:hypothetical protein
LSRKSIVIVSFERTRSVFRGYRVRGKRRTITHTLVAAVGPEQVPRTRLQDRGGSLDDLGSPAVILALEVIGDRPTAARFVNVCHYLADDW